LIEQITQVSLAGVLVLLILREVFAYLRGRKNGDSPGSGRRPTSEKIQVIQHSVDAILSRLDRIIERLEDLADAARETRRQGGLTADNIDRVRRQLDQIEDAIDEIATKRTSTTQPSIGDSR